MSDSLKIELQVIKNDLPKISAGLEKALAAGIDMWAAQVVKAAAANVPVETGGLRSSGFRITDLANTYGQAVGALQSANPKATAAPEPDKVEHGAVIGFAAGYALYVHDGHHTRSGSFVPGVPFLTSAIGSAGGQLHDNCARSINALVENADAEPKGAEGEGDGEGSGGFGEFLTGLFEGGSLGASMGGGGGVGGGGGGGTAKGRHRGSHGRHRGHSRGHGRRTGRSRRSTGRRRGGVRRSVRHVTAHHKTHAVVHHKKHAIVKSKVHKVAKAKVHTAVKVKVHKPPKVKAPKTPKVKVIKPAKVPKIPKVPKVPKVKKPKLQNLKRTINAAPRWQRLQEKRWAKLERGKLSKIAHIHRVSRAVRKQFKRQHRVALTVKTYTVRVERMFRKLTRNKRFRR